MAPPYFSNDLCYGPPLRQYEEVSPGRCLACVNIVGFLCSTPAYQNVSYCKPWEDRSLISDFWCFADKIVRSKRFQSSYCTKVWKVLLSSQLSRLARKRMLCGADKGWSVGRWNERVRAERCEVVDWDQILNLQRSRTASWDYQGNIGKWDMTEFSNSSRKRGKTAWASFTPHHTSCGEQSARFIAQHLSTMLRRLSSANPFKLESLGSFSLEA